MYHIINIEHLFNIKKLASVLKEKNIDNGFKHPKALYILKEIKATKDRVLFV